MSAQNERLGGMLIFCIVFLGLFIALIATLPSEFFVASSDYTQYEVPNYFSQEDIQHIKYSRNDTSTPGTIITLDFTTDVNFKFHVQWYTIDVDNWEFRHVTWEWGVFFTEDVMTIESYGSYVTAAQVIAGWDESFNASILYPVKCGHITTKVWFTDTNTSRNDISAAINDHSVLITMGFGFDDYSTKLSAWDIVGRLLTFQSPEVFGMTGLAATILNLIVALPTWAALAYLIYRLILLAIPFVGG